LLGMQPSSTQRFVNFRSIHLPGLEISRGHHSGPLPPWRLLPVVRITLLLEGEAELRWLSQRFRQKAGDCIIGAPDCTPKIERRITAEARTLHAYVEPALFDEWMRPRNGPSSRSFQAGCFDDEPLAGALEQLAADVEGDLGQQALRASFDRLLGEVQRVLASARSSGHEVRQRPELRRLREILRERLAEVVTLDELTEEVGLSKFHLLRLFRDEVGMPPHAFQLQLRISRAQQLLASGVSAADVAVACGFADQSHFIHCFKRIVGFTPGAFKRLA
jgi:AraC-like DNA-binding protein